MRGVKVSKSKLRDFLAAAKLLNGHESGAIDKEIAKIARIHGLILIPK